MKEPDKSAEQSSASGKDQDEALIFTPISIARARHASAHNPSVIGDAAQGSSSKKGQSAGQVQPTATSNNGAFSMRPNSCLFLTFISVVFVLGGILGGIVGGGLLLWVNNAGTLALVDNTPTVTPSPTPSPMPVQTATPTPTPTPAATRAIEDVIAGVIPSVVTVINRQNNDFTAAPIFEDGRVVGSGVIVDSRGYIATNNHVVDTPKELSVVLSDGREVPAELVAANPAEDLAILKISLTDLPIIDWAESGHPRPGQVVYAIGSPLGDFPSSVSFGIVSGLNRALEIDKYVIDGLIQTDAAINRGSSGGPLINTQGKVIGINTFIIRESEERGIAEGIAFAIPAETAKSLLIPWIAAHTGESVPIPASEDTE